MLQSVLKLYQHVLLKRSKIYHLHHCIHLLLIRTSDSTSSSFRSLVICFATAPVSICVVFVPPHRYLFTILGSGNMFLNTLVVWSTLLKGRLFSTKKPEKISLAFPTFWFKFVVAEENHLKILVCISKKSRVSTTF